MIADIKGLSKSQVEQNLTERLFNVDYYCFEYPDIAVPREALYRHFMSVGWIEGRNPHPYFDLVTYLLDHPDVACSGVNPFYHFLYHGEAEGRRVVPAVSPIARSKLALGYDLPDWVGRLRSVVDLDYYRRFLPPNDGPAPDMVAHFAYRGWREGLDPAVNQSTSAMIRSYGHAAGLLLNPFLAHQEVLEGRYVPPDVPNLISGDPLILLRPEFDSLYYLSTYKDVEAAGVDPLKHYFYTGWREGRNPRADFDTNFYLNEYEDVRSSGLNPLWHFVAVGKADGRATCSSTGLDASPIQAADEAVDETSDDDVAALVAAEFSSAYYLSQYEDIRIAGVDPLHHFLVAGWREGRSPCRGFDTAYYLEANPDVRTAGINPFWHFLVAGRAEGRPGERPGGIRRRILDAARTPRERSQSYRPVEGVLMNGRAFGRRLAGALSERSRLAVSLSHDCYTRVIGGTQIFISDEEQRFRKLGFAYLQLSPRMSSLALAEPTSNFEVQVVLDGQVLGLMRLDLLGRILERQVPSLPSLPVFIVHSLLGFDPAGVAALQDRLRPARSLFWLHDYTALCEGFNLLRNDLDHCGAPPVDSMACRVCVYGEARRRHLDRMTVFLESGGYEIVAPSAAAMEVWNARGPLPNLPKLVHPHWELDILRPSRPKSLREGPFRVAFVGFPSASKGWNTFVRLVEEMAGDADFEFLHFAAQGTSTIPEVHFIVTEVTPSDRSATQRLLSAHKVDILAMLSPWPETFSFVAHEGLLAGCLLLCVDDSGNVAALARRTGRGWVLRDTAAVITYFTSGAAKSDTLAARQRVPRFTARPTGTSATIEGVA